MASGTGPEAVNTAQVPTGTGSTAARPAAPSPGPSPPRPSNEDEQARDYAKDTLPQALPLPLRDRPGHPAAARRELEPVKAVAPLGAEPRASADPEVGAPTVRRTGNATRTVREHPAPPAAVAGRRGPAATAGRALSSSPSAEREAAHAADVRAPTVSPTTALRDRAATRFPGFRGGIGIQRMLRSSRRSRAAEKAPGGNRNGEHGFSRKDAAVSGRSGPATTRHPVPYGRADRTGSLGASGARTRTARGTSRMTSMASDLRTSDGTQGNAIRRRLAAAVAVPVVIGAGLGLRAVATGDVAKYGGDALYTLLMLALVVLVAPRTTPPRAAGVALAVSWGIEFLQLTGLPAELAQHSTAARLVLGSTFNTPDLFWYAAGAAAGWLVMRGCAALRRDASLDETDA